MPAVVLKASLVPAGSGGGGRSHHPAGPLFRGSGDVDYLCGNCNFAIASAMGPTQRVPFERTICPSCGSENEFPAQLRG